MTNLIKSYKKVQWIIFSIALLIYINTIPNQWAIDDGIIIYQNGFVKRGVSGIPSIFSTEAFTGHLGKDMNMVEGGRYRPLSQAVFALQAEAFAPNTKDDNGQLILDKEGYKIKDLSDKTLFPHILHLFNTLWYGLLCLLLYRILLLLFKIRQTSDDFQAYFLALVSTLIFVVHPLHTEAVANVKGLDEILAMLGSIATLFFIVKQYQQQQNVALQKPSRIYVIGALICFTLALFAKENSVTFMAVIPLALWFFTYATIKSITRLTLPLLLPLFVFIGVRSAVLHQPDKGEIRKELMNDPFLVLDAKAEFKPLLEGSDIMVLVNPNENTYTKMPYSQQLATNFYTWGKYLKLLIVPHPLTTDYYPRHISIKSFTDFWVLLSVLVHLLLIGWALFNLRKRKVIAFGIIYYFITFSIVSNLLFPIGTNMAERFMFMPSLGFCIIVASLLYSLGSRWSQTNEKIQFKPIYIIVGAIICIYAALTVNRNFDWKDNYTLFSKDVHVSGNSGKINMDLGAYLIIRATRLHIEAEEKAENMNFEEKKALKQNVEVDRVALLNRAISLLKRSLSIHPMGSESWFQISNAFNMMGDIESNTPEQKVHYLTTALAAYEQAYLYRSGIRDKALQELKAICYMNLGKTVGEKFGDIDSSIMYLEKSIAIDSLNAEAYMILGTAYSMKKDFEKSISYSLKSLELRPEDRGARKNLAAALQQYAFEDATQISGLYLAEKTLLELLAEEKELPDHNMTKQNALLRTLDLLIRNYAIQGRLDKALEYQSELNRIKNNSGVVY